MRALPLLFFIFMYAFSFSTQAGVCTSQASGDWDNPANWSGGAVPTVTDDVVIQATHSIILDAGAGIQATVLSITLQNAASNGGTLSIDGIDLNVTNDVTVEGQSSFDIAAGALVSIGGDLIYENNGNVEVTGNGSIYISGCIYKGTGGGADADKVLASTLTYCVSGNGGCDTHGVTGEGNGGCGTLPVTLIYFRAALIESEVKLTWATASEENNASFTIEKSTDGNDFTPLMEIAGSGNSTETIEYEEVDNQELAAITYYRLKQTDHDGKFTYSKITQIYLDQTKAVGHVVMYPNPSIDNKFRIDGFNMSYMLVKVYDQLGKEVKIVPKAEQFTWGVEGYYELETQSVGMYYVVIQTDKGSYQEKLLIKK